MVATIMVVDDEPDLEHLITQKYRKQIRDKEMEFVFARNGEEALKKLQDHHGVDMVVTDINMPVMDGLTLIAEVTKQFPQLKSIIVSAYGDMVNIRAALNRGAFDFLTKPVDLQDLQITVDKTLQEVRAARQAELDRHRLMSIQKELDVARNIQKTIVPSKFPPFPERQDFELHAEMLPANEVGGDFYDFFLIDDSHLGFVIGDVSGKGIPAALLMAVTRTLLKSTALKGLAPADCLRDVNHLLCKENVSAMFVSAFYGVLNTITGEVEYCNGGHNPPFLFRKNGDVIKLDITGGLVLGIVPDFEYSASKIKLEKRDGLLLYTDGVTEGINKRNRQFSEERLQACLASAKEAASGEIVKRITEEVQAFASGASQADDITVLALRYLGK